jgi:hypothetical protein
MLQGDPYVTRGAAPVALGCNKPIQSTALNQNGVRQQSVITTTTCRVEHIDMTLSTLTSCCCQQQGQHQHQHQHQNTNTNFNQQFLPSGVRQQSSS